MNQGPPIVHYEVYTLEANRWMLHARFHRQEREVALEEAKLVERSLGVIVKVVRETYYPGNNACDESVIYASEKLIREGRGGNGGASSALAARARGPARGGDFEPPDHGIPDFQIVARRPGTTTPPARPMGVVVKLLIVIAASLVGSAALTGIVSAFASRLPQYGMDISEKGLSVLLFATFVVSFLSTAVPMAMKMIDWTEGAQLPPPPKPQPRPAPRQPRPRPAPVPQEIPPEPFPTDDLESDGEELDWSDVESEEAQAPTAIPPLPEPEPAPAEEPEAPAAAPKEEAKAEESPAGDGLETHRKTMVRFLSALLGEVKKARPTLDAYNKFGVDLLLAGAIEVLGNQSFLEGTDKRIVLKETIEVMGTKADTAKAFADKYEDYLVEPRYMAMVQVGRNAMECFLAGTDAASDQVAAVFGAWNKPQTAAQAAPRIMTVLFTDMVGSTDLTQTRGDQAAQEIVRRHNTIVRAALAEYSGKEVKHTGDGIMASFASAANGVEAAIAIQKAVAVHNDRHRELPLRLRIGMNAGEPIEEEDDLFGTTVQLAARVCAHCDSDQIFCTNVVRELSAGKGLVFVAMGAHDLKGFKERVPLYEVMWDPKAIAALPAGALDKKKP